MGYGYHGKRSAAADEGTGYLRVGYERYGAEGYENAVGYYAKREAVAEAEPGRKRGNKCHGKREAEPGCYRGKREAVAVAEPGRKQGNKCHGKMEADPGCYRGKRAANAEPGYIFRGYGYGGYGYSGYGIGGGYY